MEPMSSLAHIEVPHGTNVPKDILRFPHETNVLVPSSDHLRHVNMKSTFLSATTFTVGGLNLI
jgi:hypothetical protein